MSDLGIFGIHEKALKVRAKKAELIAGNIANADTPGYKARDLDFRSILSSANNMNEQTIKSTHENHLGNGSSQFKDQMKFRMTAQASIDGNTVDGQVEQAEFAKNSLRLMATQNFLTSRIKGIKGALRGD